MFSVLRWNYESRGAFRTPLLPVDDSEFAGSGKFDFGSVPSGFTGSDV